MSEHQQPIRLVIAGGGTGGHVLPAVAVVEELRRRGAVGEMLWIGSRAGVEREAAEANGIPFAEIETGKLRRYPSIQTVTDAGRIPVGVVQARRLLRAFRPSVVFSTGGFVSVPTVIAAKGTAPVLTHEQTAIIGLANRINARFADVFAVSWDQTAKIARAMHRRVIVTGNPVRGSILHGDRTAGLRRFGFDDQRPLLYVTGGARGATPINDRVAAMVPSLLEQVQVLHQTGPDSANSDLAAMQAAAAAWPEALRRRYHALPFIREGMADVYAAADIVLGRAGAGTVAELSVLGLPSILVPLPGAGGDEQTLNARLLGDVGAAVVLPQPDATPERLQEIITGLATDPSRRTAMADAARTIGKPQAAADLADALLSIARREN